MRKISWKRAALGLLLVMAPALARADIGDTLDELRQHYGSAKDLGGQMLFEVRLRDGQIVPAHGAADVENHFTVTVYFDGIHSAMEIFTRNTTDPAKASMTADDVQAILHALGRGLAWEPVQTPSGKQTWVWGDEKDAPPKLLARFDESKSGREDDASVLVVMVYTKK